MANFLPGFIVEWVTTRGFWWVILAGMVFNIGFTIVGMILGLFKKIALGNVIAYVPNVFFWFYIAQVREPVGWLICAIIVAVGTVAVIIGGFRHGAGSVSPESLQIEAMQMAPNLPTMVEDGLRLDSVLASGLNITYSYTFTALSGAKRSDPSMVTLRTNIGNALLTSLNQNNELRAYRESGVVFAYSYKNAEGVFLFRFDFGPKEYQGFKGQEKVVPIIVLIALVAFGVYALNSGSAPSAGKPKAVKEVTATVNANVNFRSEPTTGGDNIIRQLKQGETIIITGEAKDGWTPIQQGKDRGWISSEFVVKE